MCSYPRAGGAYFPHGVDSASNRLQYSGGPGPARFYLHDAAGNVVTDGTHTYHYNGPGRMDMAYWEEAGQPKYVFHRYNGLGQRVAKVPVSSQVFPIGLAGATDFAYDEQGHLIGEYDSINTGLPTGPQETVYLGDIPVAVLKPATTPGNPAIHYVYADHLNAPRPFGDTPADENPSGLGTFTYNLRFPGQYFDSETGLFHNGFRDYDPAIGRYRESDPLGLAGGINTYAYADSNPINRVDPDGLRTGRDGDGRGSDGRRGRDGEPWPSPDDWRGQCIRLYERCIMQNWIGDCGSCLNKCTAQQEWPFQGPGSCRPRRNQCEIR